MAFFSKLRNKMKRSSSKIEEGLEAIVQEGGTAEEVTEIEEGTAAPSGAETNVENNIETTPETPPPDAEPTPEPAPAPVAEPLILGPAQTVQPAPDRMPAPPAPLFDPDDPAPEAPAASTAPDVAAERPATPAAPDPTTPETPPMPDWHPTPEPQPIPDPAPVPEVPHAPQPDPTPEPAPIPAPEPERQPEPAPEPDPEPLPEPEPAPAPRPVEQPPVAPEMPPAPPSEVPAPVEETPPPAPQETPSTAPLELPGDRADITPEPPKDDVVPQEPARTGFFGRMRGRDPEPPVGAPAPPPDIDAPLPDLAPAPEPAPEPAPAPRMPAPPQPATAMPYERPQSALDALSADSVEEIIEEAPRKGLFGRVLGGGKRTVIRRELDDDMLESLEELLISADMGVDTALRVTANMAEGRFGKRLSVDEIKQLLAQEIALIMDPVARPMPLYPKKPQVVLVVGVNGSGKTTTIGKLASQFRAAGKTVIIAAGDTFRAAAVEQLQVWGTRAGVPVMTAPEGSDPASLAFDAMARAEAEGTDLLMIDTAGRLQNRADLMAELEKIVRVIRKRDETAPHNTLLVLDATTGQNALSQVETFQKLADVSGLVMTKLDGTAKGGVLVALADKFGLPIHAIGVGEQIDDLAPFEPEEFANALAGIDG